MGSGVSTQLWQELQAAIQRNDVAAVNDFLTRVDMARSGGRGANCAGDRKTVQALQALDLNEAALNGRTALQHAAACCSVDVVRRLLASPLVDADRLDCRNATALHLAAGVRSPPRCASCVAALLDHGADHFVAAQDGSTPLDMARRAQCVQCVRVIESRSLVWQAWVDHEERGFPFPSWKPKWLVLLRDRRPNTGPSHSSMTQVACFGCGAVLRLQPFARQVRCTGCSAENAVAVSLQLAVYTPPDGHAARLAAAGAAPEVAMPSAYLTLPQDTRLIEVKPLEEAALTNATRMLLQGKFRRALQNTVTSERRHGMCIKIKDARGTELFEQCFRLDTEAQRDLLLRLLSDPVKASYEASQLSTSMPIATVVSSAALASVATATAGCASATADRQPPATVPPASGRWACGRCTFVHTGVEAAAVECIMCGGPRPAEALIASPAARTAEVNGLVGGVPSAPLLAELDGDGGGAAARADGDNGANGGGSVAGGPDESWRAFANRPEGSDAYKFGDITRGVLSLAFTSMAPGENKEQKKAEPDVPTPCQVSTAGASSSTAPAPPPHSARSPVGSQAAPAPAASAPCVQAPLPASAPTSAPPGSAPAAGTPPAGSDDDQGMCVVCLDIPADTAVVPCGHMCGCSACLNAIQASSDAHCPMCRGPMSSTIRIFRS